MYGQQVGTVKPRRSLDDIEREVSQPTASTASTAPKKRSLDDIELEVSSSASPAPRKGKSTFAPGPRYDHPPDGQHRGYTTNYKDDEPVVRTPEERVRDNRIGKPPIGTVPFKSPVSLDFRAPTEAQKLVDRALPAAQPKPQPKARPRNAFQAPANRQSTFERIQNQQAAEMRNPQPQTVETDSAKLEELGRATSTQQALQRETRQQLDRANRIQSLRGTPSLDPVSRTGARIAGLLRGASPQEMDEAVPRMADVPVVGQAEDITNRFVGSAVRGAAGIPEGLARFADRQLNRGDLAIAQAMEQALAMHPEWSPEEKQAAKAKINQIYANQSAIGDTFAGLTKAGEQASRIVTPADPNKQGSINPLNPNFYSVTLPEAAGSMAPFMAGGAAGAAAKIPTALTSGILGVGMSVPDQYRKAKELGASPDQLARAVDTGTLAGLIESLGAKSLMGEVAETGRRFIPRVLGESAKEASQEALQSGVSDLGAKYNERTQPNLTAQQMLANAAQQAIPAAFLGGAGGLGSSNVAQRQAEMTRAEQPAPMNLRPTMTGPTQITRIPQATTATQPAIEPQSAIPAQTAKPRTAPAENVNPATPPPAVEFPEGEAGDLMRMYRDLLGEDDPGSALTSERGDLQATKPLSPIAATPANPTEPTSNGSAESAPTVTGALRAEADASKIEAAEFEQAGDFEQAASAYDATHKNLKLLQQKIGRPKTPEDVARLGQIQRELSSAARNRQRATAQAKQMARQANAPTKGLPSNEKAKGDIDGKSGRNYANNMQPVQASAPQVQQAQVVAQEPVPIEERTGNTVDFTPKTPARNRRNDTENLTIAGMLKRRFPEGIRIADKGEARNLGGREGNALVGLVNKNSRTGIDDAAYALHEEGLTLPDGRPFVEDGRVVATEADVLDFIRSNGKQKVGGTKSLAKGLEQEEAEYYASQEGQLSPNFDEIVADVDSEFTPDTGDLRAVREFGQRNEETDDYTEEPQTAPLARRPARMKESPEVTAMREHEKLPLIERREALRQAVPKGQFGKISEAAYKNRPNALVEHPQLRRLLGLKEMPVYRLPNAAINPKTGEPYVNPEWSAEAQNTLNMLANLAGKERSSQISFTEGERHGKTGQPTRSEMGEVYAAVSRLARRKGETVDPGLRSAFEEAVTRARTHNQGWQEFTVDDRTENIRQSLYERIRNGNLTRKEESALRTSFKSVAADFGISESSAADLFNQARDEARRRAERSGSKPSPSATTQSGVAERGERISGNRPSGEAAKTATRVSKPDSLAQIENDLSWGAITDAEAKRRKAALKEQQKTGERQRDTFQPSRLEDNDGYAGAAIDIRIRQPKVTSRANTIYGNEQAQFFINRAEQRMNERLAQETGGEYVPTTMLGANLSAKEAYDFAKEIRKDKYWWKDAAPNVKAKADAQIESLAEAFEETANQYGRVLYIAGDRGFSSIRGTVYHELAHDTEREFTTTKNWFESQPQAEKIGKALTERGYAPEQYLSESVAHIVGGQWGKINLSLDEATDFLDNYLSNITFRAGRDAAQAFKTELTAPAMRPALREAQRKYGQVVSGSRQSVSSEERASTERGTGRQFAERSQNRSERGRETSAQEVAGRKGRFSFGSLANEPRGQIAASGLGGLQSLFGRGKSVKTPAKYPIPKDFDLAKWSEKTLNDALVNALPAKAKEEYAKATTKADKLKILAQSQLSNDAAKEIKAMMAKVKQAVQDGDGGAIYDAIVDSRKFLIPPRTKVEKVKVATADALNLPRALMASADISAPLRQGAILTLPPSQWGKAAKATVTMFEALVANKARYREIQKRINLSPNAAIAKDAGLYISTDESGLRKTEEDFVSGWTNHIPILKHSEQAYKAYLDTLRMETFSRYKKSIDKNKGLNTEQKQEAYKAAVNWINIATGRGTLGQHFENMLPTLSKVMFAPRYTASRIQILNPATYAKNMSTSAGRAVLKGQMSDLIQFSGVIAATLALAAANGATVGYDPDDADFLKIKVGNTRYDMLAGLQQPMRLFWRMGKSLKEKATGEKSTSRQDALDIASRFGRSKLAPIPSFFVDAVTGKTFTGENFDTKKGITDRVLPLMWKDFYDAYQKEGAEGAAKILPGLVGIGVQNYGERAGSLKPTKFSSEAESKGLNYDSVRPKKGEPEAVYKQRVERVQTWMTEYGDKLIANPRYNLLTEAEKKAAIELLRDRIGRQQNLVKPRTALLEPNAVLLGVRKSAADRPKRQSKYLYSQP